MATVTKDFKVKSGLVVEGATATVNNYDVLTKKQEDQNYIVDLIGGTATPENTPNTVVKRDGNGNFVANEITADLIGDVTGNVVGNLTGDVTGTVSTLSNHDTDDLAEGTNLYFTNSRAQSAVATDIATAKSEAISTASDDATTKANAAQTAAQGYADSLATNYDAAGSATTAENNAKAYADGLAVNYDAAGAAATAESNAIASANGYTDTAVANLVDSAPALLDTLNELAAAINDDANFASTIGTSIGEKVAKSGDTMTGELVLAADPTQALAAATKQYADSVASGAYNDAIVTAAGTAQTYANTAEQNAKDYADGLATNYDAAGSASTAETNANTYTDNAINALTTDDIPEETLAPVNRYFTDARAKTAAADLLTSANLTNITITGDGNGITIAAENGVADSTTSDLAEGSNLYFTNERAVTALEAVVPNFTEIDLNNIVTNVATQATVATASQVTAHEFDSAVYRSAEYTVKVAYGSHTELSKVMITLDSADNIAITEYAVVGTNGSASTITADVNAGNVRLRVTTANNNSVVTVFGTIIK
jgi:hypothetical protein